MPDDIQNSPDTSTSESSADLSVSEAASQALDAATSQAAPEAQDSRESKAADDSQPSWEKVDPRLRGEYETTTKRWKDTQAYLTKQQQEWKAREGKFKEYETAAQQFARLDDLYRSNQEVQAAIDKALGRKSNVNPDLEQDPLYQHLQERDRRFEEQLNPVVRWVQEQQEAMRQRENEARVDRATEAATKKFEAYMGRKATPQEIGKIYDTMVEKRVYDGEAATLTAFQEEIIQAKVQAALDAQMAKKNVGTRVSSVNSGKSKSGKDYDSMSMKEILASGLEEMGFN